MDFIGLHNINVHKWAYLYQLYSHVTRIISITTATTKVFFCKVGYYCNNHHYDDVIMTVMASQITSLTIVYSTVYSDADQRKHQSSASLAFVGGIHRGPVNSPHKWPVPRKIFPFDDVLMITIMKNTKAANYWPFSTVDKRDTNEESVSMSWCRHALEILLI